MSDSASERTASVVRKTKETDIRIELALDGSGQYDVSTGIPFFDHMLESFAKHGLFDLEIAAKGVENGLVESIAAGIAAER